MILVPYFCRVYRNRFLPWPVYCLLPSQSWRLIRWYTQVMWTDELLSAQFHRWWCGEGGILLGAQAGEGPQSSSSWPRVQRARPSLQRRKLGAAWLFRATISEEEVTEQQLKYFCVGMQSPEVKQTAVKMVADGYSTVIVKVVAERTSYFCLARNLIWPLGSPHIFAQSGLIILFSLDHLSEQHQKLGKVAKTFSFSSELFSKDRRLTVCYSITTAASHHHEESHLIYGPLASILLDHGFLVEYELDDTL